MIGRILARMKLSTTKTFMNKLIILLHFIIASLLTVVSACILQTQMVLLGLSDINIDISWADRLSMSWQDLLGLLPSYGVVVTIGLAIGFSVAKLISKKTSLRTSYLYIIAGGFTMTAILLAMQPILGVTLLAGARSTLGVSLQVLAGLVGGYCFMRLRQKHKG
jgi:hypothetical protein